VGDLRIVRATNDVEVLSRGLERFERRTSVRPGGSTARARLPTELEHDDVIVDIELPVPDHFDLDAFEVSGRLAALTREDPMSVLRLIEQTPAIIGAPAATPPSAGR
jgi:hypothetical protein